MKLSESLTALATRVARMEDSAAAAAAENRTELESRRREIEVTVDKEVKDFEAAVNEADAAGREWWNDLRSSITRQIDAMRSDVERRQAEHEAARAQRKAEHEVAKAVREAERAEEDAAAAIALATYCLNAAEYAVVDAALARARAAELTSTAPVLDNTSTQAKEEVTS